MEKFVSVIIPAYNEEESIAEVVKKVFKHKEIFEVLVCDDGSSDNTANEAQKAGAKVLKHPYNIGNGAAVKNGLRHAKGKFVLLMDADLQHPPEEIANMIKYIDKYDMVIGSRTSSSSVSKFRTFGNWILIKIAEFLAEHKIMDLTSGFRLINREKCIKFINLLPNKYSYPTTITLCFFNKGYTIKFLPLDSITKRKMGTSKINPFKDGLRFIFIIFRIVMLFNPLKIFLPISAFLFVIGIIQSIYTLFILDAGIKSASIISFVTCFMLIGFGMLAEQVSEIRKNMIPE